MRLDEVMNASKRGCKQEIKLTALLAGRQTANERGNSSHTPYNNCPILSPWPLLLSAPVYYVGLCAECVSFSSILPVWCSPIFPDFVL